MDDINIKVNGKQIPLTDFPSEIIKNTICGMLKVLKGVDEINDVEISFRMWIISKENILFYFYLFL